MAIQPAADAPGVGRVRGGRRLRIRGLSLKVVESSLDRGFPLGERSSVLLDFSGFLSNGLNLGLSASALFLNRGLDIGEPLIISTAVRTEFKGQLVKAGKNIGQGVRTCLRRHVE